MIATGAVIALGYNHLLRKGLKLAKEVAIEKFQDKINSKSRRKIEINSEDAKYIMYYTYAPTRVYTHVEDDTRTYFIDITINLLKTEVVDTSEVDLIRNIAKHECVVDIDRGEFIRF